VLPNFTGADTVTYTSGRHDDHDGHDDHDARET